MNLTTEELQILQDAMKYKLDDIGISFTADEYLTLFGKIGCAIEGVDTEALAKKQLDNLL